jgi:hypothetical protein
MITMDFDTRLPGSWITTKKMADLILEPSSVQKKLSPFERKGE